eukprot:CAMPEP_0206145558 /NCGR_PEP_ID=MMETSP1473-20131121/27753_1 /ASSEMBLY_ACC=CAM_ASM_001109 /TAXON_ID=1461547 /ORGANISM="Stichococcus sp, Strain RCC1054" /LENGTH=41 /DNA_ID= /DNA_START= /DNA_END= /DNA_ORIENTATION=
MPFWSLLAVDGAPLSSGADATAVAPADAKPAMPRRRWLRWT